MTLFSIFIFIYFNILKGAIYPNAFWVCLLMTQAKPKRVYKSTKDIEIALVSFIRFKIVSSTTQ